MNTRLGDIGMTGQGNLYQRITGTCITTAMLGDGEEIVTPTQSSASHCLALGLGSATPAHVSLQSSGALPLLLTIHPSHKLGPYAKHKKSHRDLRLTNKLHLYSLSRSPMARLLFKTQSEFNKWSLRIYYIVGISTKLY